MESFREWMRNWLGIEEVEANLDLANRTLTTQALNIETVRRALIEVAASDNFRKELAKHSVGSSTPTADQSSEDEQTESADAPVGFPPHLGRH